ncbi:MAG: cation transporter [Bacteroidetes bacterium]|nr:cation transporter [Bacteroidota bacterium]MBU1372683.1 cation transporter [Bacteroidota bacterium]MBU1484879.1 cation transporter [Bacteroidota bacterium]MBU1761556.1 cation transporter [Bacteroidota bacterium]MBU2046417.1 cation transporter [Bacteroidota bacterium]
MKTILIIASSLLLLAGTQMCGCGSCAVAQSTTLNNTVNEIKTVKLKITGMTCVGCSNHVSSALKNIDGVIEQHVEYPGDIATIKYDASKTNPTEMIKAIEKAGYNAVTINETNKKKS